MTAGRNDDALPPEQVAAAIIRGIGAGRDCIVLGKARVLSAVNRSSPALAHRVMRKR